MNVCWTLRAPGLLTALAAVTLPLFTGCATMKMTEEADGRSYDSGGVVSAYSLEDELVVAYLAIRPGRQTRVAWFAGKALRDGEVSSTGEELPADFPVGVAPDVDYGQTQHRLAEGDIMYVFTDGVTEAMDAEGQLYGEERLKKALTDAERTASGAMDAVLADVDRHVAGAPPSDDLTCVCFQVLPAGAPTPGPGDDATRALRRVGPKPKP